MNETKTHKMIYGRVFGRFGGNFAQTVETKWLRREVEMTAFECAGMLTDEAASAFTFDIKDNYGEDIALSAASIVFQKHFPFGDES